MKYLPYIVSVFIPLRVHAAVGSDVFTLQQFIYDFLSKLTILFWVASVAFFVFGVVKFIKNADDSAEREKGKLFIVWAIIAFAVLASLWALVEVFASTIGVTTGGVLNFVDKNGKVL